MKPHYYKLLISAAMLAMALSANGQVITTVAGNGTEGYSGDGGPATAAEFQFASAVSFDAAGNLYIIDQAAEVIRKVNPAGIISTIAGNDTAGYNGDSILAINAQLGDPEGHVAFDAAGNMYFAESFNHRIRKVSTTGIITTVAGNGVPGYSGDGGLATNAEIQGPWGVAFDTAGNMYFAEESNNIVRKVSTSGIISTVAGIAVSGIGSFSGDGGPAIAATLSSPRNVTFDAAGNMFIVDNQNGRIRKINTADIISTVAGSSGAGYSGDGGMATAAELTSPSDVVVDAAGNLYIGDTYNNVIRKVNTSGTITTIAGNGYGAASGLSGTAIGGYSGDGGAATDAELWLPVGCALDAAGYLYIADANNYRIRKVRVDSAGATGISQVNAANGNMTLLPNHSNGSFTVRGVLNSKTDENVIVEVVDMQGQIVFRDSVTPQRGVINKQFNLSANLASGVYQLHIIAGTENMVLHFVVAK